MFDSLCISEGLRPPRTMRATLSPLTSPHTTTFPHAFVLPIHFLRISPLLLVPLCCLLPTCVRIRHPLLVKERAYYPVSWSVRLRFSMHFVEEGGLEPLPSGNYTQGMLLGYVHYPCLIQPDALPTELFPRNYFIVMVLSNQRTSQRAG